MSFLNFVKEQLERDSQTLSVSNRDETMDVLTTYATIYVKTRLKELRGSKNQSEVADQAGLRQPAISRIENPDNTRLSLSSLSMIAAALDAVVVIEIRPRSEIIAELAEASK